MDLTMKLKLHSVEDVKNFIATTNAYGTRQELRQGRYVVDAKSILGVMSLDLSKPIEFWAEKFEADLQAGLAKYGV